MVTMSTVLHVKLDEKLKKEAQEAAKTLGLPLSTVVASSLREFVRTRSITISDTPKLRPEVERELLELAKVPLDERDGLSPVFTSIDDARDWLQSN